MPSLIGNKPNQVPTNGDLGTLAFQDSNAVQITGGSVATTSTTLGSASANPLTINSSAVSIPNGLNFDSNTFVIDATNNRVGIGTASPNYALHIAGQSAYLTSGASTALTFIDINSAYGTIRTGIDASGVGYFGSVSNFALALYTNNSERLRIDTSGNVGIGTSSPNTKLQVITASGSDGVEIATASGASRRRVLMTVDGTAGYIDSYNFAGSAGAALSLNPNGGNVGIGTSSPRDKLDVNGTVLVAGGGQIQITGNVSTTGLQLIGQDAAESIVGTMSSQPLVFRTNASERMRIDANGDLQLGTTTAVTSNGRNLNIYGASASNLSLQNATSGTGNGNGFQLIQDGLDTYVYNRENGAMLFATNNTERMRIASNGALGFSGANYGTSGQVLTSNGSGSAPSWTTPSTSSGTVTSVATGNGLQGGTITTTGTLSIACPTAGSVGSYVFGHMDVSPNSTITWGSNYAAGAAANQVNNTFIQANMFNIQTNNLSGTWKYFGRTATGDSSAGGSLDTLFCRVS